LELDFELEGSKSQFNFIKSESPIGKKKKTNKEDKEEISERDLELSQPETNKSEINLKLNPLKIYLSVESVKPLYQFFTSFSAVEKLPNDMKDTTESQNDDLSIEDFQSLMECVSHNNSSSVQKRFETYFKNCCN